MEKKKPFWQWFFKGYWPYWLGAVILGVFNIIITMALRKPWGVTGDFTNWGLHVWSSLGGQPEQLIHYFQEAGPDFFLKKIFYNEATVLNLGLVFGVMLAVTLASQFRIKGIKSKKQLFLGITAGILMGYGARLALGCNVGSLIGGIASQSLHGWVFALFAFLGSLTGVFVLRFYLK